MPREAARAPEPAAPERAQSTTPATPALAVTPGAPLDAATALRLQASAGNRAVARLAQQPTRTLARKKPTKAEKAAADFQAAVTTPDWPEAVKALGLIDEGAAVVLMRARSTAEVTSIAAAAKPLAGKKSKLVYRLARFVLNDPGAAAAHAALVSVSTEGKLRASAKVRGGKIKVRTGGKTKNLGSGLESEERFWLSYEGTDAPSTRWLQFIWREIVATDPVKGKYRVAGNMTTTGGSYALTTDPKQPSYNTDVVPGAANPFYETTGINNRTADSTTIFDLPYNASDKVDGAFDAGATKVVSRAHFVTYLVRDWQVLHKANIDIEWRFGAKGDTPARRQSAGVSSAGKLDSRQHDRLVAQYPKFDYLP
jgi:hypothetical protein